MRRRRRPAPGRGLSGKILLLAIAFVLLGEVLIYLPSIARFRYAYLEARVAAAHLATIAVEPERVETLPPAVEADLLRYAGVVAITLYRPRAELMLGEEVPSTGRSTSAAPPAGCTSSGTRSRRSWRAGRRARCGCSAPRPGTAPSWSTS
jgi:hypothetical protein